MYLLKPLPSRIKIDLFDLIYKILIVKTLRNSQFPQSTDNIGKTDILRTMSYTGMALKTLPNLAVAERLILQTMKDLTHYLTRIKAVIYFTDRTTGSTSTAQKTIRHMLPARMSSNSILKILIGQIMILLCTDSILR